MAEKRHEGGVSYHIPGKDYFEKRELKRHAGVFALWALGVGAVISGDFSGWNLGFAVGGWGGMFVATIIIAIMYLGLTYSIAEMSPALPHTGGAYSFARTAFGPWGGFITGIAENIEYVLTPAVVVYFIGTYMTAIVGTPNALPAGLVDHRLRHLRRAQRAWRRIVVQGHRHRDTDRHRDPGLLSAQRALSGQFDFAKWAMNIGVGPDGAAVALPDGHGPFLPFGIARRSRLAALCGVAVPRHRAVAARRGGVGRSKARHAEGHHARHVHADRAGLPGADHQPAIPTRESTPAPSADGSFASAPRASQSSTASA